MSEMSISIIISNKMSSVWVKNKTGASTNIPVQDGRVWVPTANGGTKSVPVRNDSVWVPNTNNAGSTRVHVRK